MWVSLLGKNMTETTNKANSLELPKVDWLDRESNPDRFFKDLSYALSEFGFMVLTNAPGLSDEFQKKAFREVRGFFDADMDLKKTAHISNTPCLLYTSPSPRDQRGSRMPSSA